MLVALCCEPEGELIDGEHDGSVGHHSEQMGAQTSVESRRSFFLPHELDRLQQARVLGRLACLVALPEPSSQNLVRVGDKAGYEFGHACRADGSRETILCL